MTTVLCPCCGEHQHPDDFDYNFERDEYTCLDCGGTFGGEDYNDQLDRETDASGMNYSDADNGL